MADVLVIADLCSNAMPFSRLRLADMVEQAVLSGVGAVKIQAFTRSHFPREEREAKRRSEFPRNMLEWFASLAHRWKLQAGASVFDLHAIDACVDAGFDFLKLAAREFGNGILILQVAESGLPFYTSVPFTRYGPQIVRPAGPNETLLACISSYPTETWGQATRNASACLGKPWGWSSHTAHYQDVLEAAALGASVIEKHLALSKDDPEAAWSLLPRELKELTDVLKSA